MRGIVATGLGLALSLAMALPASAGAGGAGAFTGDSNHVAKGAVELVEADGGWEIHLKDDFWFDGAPDPRVGFGTRGSFAAGTDFAPLHRNAGAPFYKVPAGIDPADFDTVVIWCRKFSVPLGHARLN
ncbi:DM13 domain-containing protein [Limibaculum sp. M0105]|uniref:DM13 domain-containing protein n=1 Tax=Thermohalobaculum xanthum TaxID=2753746 RepID=A0A8J7M4P2_9RHOB|nr:DM13 domain-containing protein [Thermohalobaculum xanthum]MBK0398381.1 DM13 domain-containing protein [Thermohalobaculum xanthum]